MKFKGQYIYTSPEDLEKINKAIAGVGNVSPGEMLQAAILGEYDSAPIVLSDEAKELIEEFTNEGKFLSLTVLRLNCVRIRNGDIPGSTGICGSASDPFWRMIWG